ncbi:MAG: ROK family protein [Muribaculaceae bacterium]|nr:ROK family protein [Muribaculaceae bacterium]
MEKKYSIGIDIGGTNTVFGIVDKDGKVIGKGSIKTKAYGNFTDYLDDLYKNIRKLIEEKGVDGEIAGIGIGAPGANYHTGEIYNAANLNWGERVELAKLVKEKFNLPVAVTNDANAATVGEMIYGAAKGMKDFIMITLGTGVGSGIVSNGELVYGHDGLAGELGHIRIERRNGRKCGCGRIGCLETYCSSTGMVRTALEFLKSDRPSSLREIPESDLNSKNVYDAAIAGDEMANEIFEFTGNILGDALADFTAYSSPEAIILFGGLAKSGDLLLKHVKKGFDDNLLFIYKDKPEIIFSQLNEDDGAVLGASALGWVEAGKEKA